MKARQRRFSAKYKLAILEEAERCTKPGELGAMLSREGNYSSHLSKWREPRDAGALAGLTPKKRGRKPRPVDPQARRVAELERENARLRDLLEKAETIISVPRNSPYCWRAGRPRQTNEDHGPAVAESRRSGRLHGFKDAAGDVLPPSQTAVTVGFSDACSATITPVRPVASRNDDTLREDVVATLEAAISEPSADVGDGLIDSAPRVALGVRSPPGTGSGDQAVIDESGILPSLEEGARLGPISLRWARVDLVIRSAGGPRPRQINRPLERRRRVPRPDHRRSDGAHPGS